MVNPPHIMSSEQARPKIAHVPSLAPAPVRTALNALRVAGNTDALKRAISSLMSSVRSHSNSISSNDRKNDPTETPAVCDTTILDYVITRLANGVSVSTGFTRANFSLALHVLLQSHPQLNVAVSRILSIYTDPPDSPGAPSVRDHVLGALVSATAMVAAAGPQLSLNEARDTIKIVRVALNPEYTQWRLAPAATAVIIRLLHAQSVKSRSQLIKPLWAICSARPHTEHSLTLALALLLDFSLVSPSAVHTLYPSLDSPLADALMSPFETGFSFFDSPQLPNTSDYKNSSVAAVCTVRDIVPHAWRLALRYVASSFIADLIGEDSCTFWQKLVTSRLLASNKPLSSITKPLVAVQLLPDIVQNLSRASDIPLIINKDFSYIVLSLVRTAKPKAQTRRRVRSSFSSKNVILCVAQAFSSIPRNFEKRFSIKQDRDGDVEALEVAFWKAIIHNGLEIAFGAPIDLCETIKCSSPAARKLILSEGINHFANPPQNSQKSSSRAVDSRRLQALGFLLLLPRAIPSVANDVIRALTLFTMFKPPLQKETAHIGKSGAPIVSFDIFEPKDRSLAGTLPWPCPLLSDSSSIAVYNRLMTFLTEKRSNLSYLEVCLETFLNALSSNEVLEAESQWKDSAKLISIRLMEIVKYSAKVDQDAENAAICSALKVLALHAGCELVDPRASQNRKNGGVEGGTTRSLMEVTNFANRVITCYNILTGQKHDATDEDLEVENIERVSHLVCVYMGREEARPSVGLQALECLSDIVDDRVVAVLFDVMYTYREGIEDFDMPLKGFDNQDMDVESSDTEESEEDGDGDRIVSDGENFGQGSQGINHSTKHVENVSDEEEDVMDVNPDIDVEAEDEETLKALDSHLSQHLRLLKEQKKSNRQRSADAKRPLLRVTNILKLIECVVRSIRIRLECNKEVERGSRTVLVFLDALVRMFEFTLSNEMDNLWLFNRITEIFSKQMREVSPALLAQHLSDSRSVMEIADRLFQAIVDCKRTKDFDDAAAGSLSAALHLLMSVSILASKDTTYPDFLSRYEKLVEVMLRDGKHIVCSGVFSSFLNQGGESLKLITTIIGRLGNSSMTKAGRRKGAALVELMASTIKRHHLQDHARKEGIALFWSTLEQFVLTELRADSLQGWDSTGMKCLLRAASLGLEEHLNAESDAHAATWFKSSGEIEKKLFEIMRKMKLVPNKDLRSTASLFRSSSTKRKLGKRSRKSGKGNVRKKQIKETVEAK